MARRQGAQRCAETSRSTRRGIVEGPSDSLCVDGALQIRQTRQTSSDCVEFCRSGGNTLLSLLVAALGFAFADLSISSTSAAYQYFSKIKEC